MCVSEMRDPQVAKVGSLLAWSNDLDDLGVPIVGNLHAQSMDDLYYNVYSIISIDVSIMSNLVI